MDNGQMQEAVKLTVDDEDTKRYIATLEGDVAKLQARLCKSEETLKKLQERAIGSSLVSALSLKKP
jgi:hypothetical protein